jgi:hypothetical protein
MLERVDTKTFDTAEEPERPSRAVRTSAIAGASECELIGIQHALGASDPISALHPWSCLLPREKAGRAATIQARLPSRNAGHTANKAAPSLFQRDSVVVLAWGPESSRTGRQLGRAASLRSGPLDDGHA